MKSTEVKTGPVHFMFRAISNKDMLLYHHYFELYLKKKYESPIRHQYGGWTRNVEEAKHMFMCCHKNAELNHNLKMANKSLRNVAKFKHSRMIATNQNCIHEEIKDTKFRNAH